MSETIHVTVEELHSLITDALVRTGLQPEAAGHTADSLTEAECAGKASHGLMRVGYVCTEFQKQRPGAVRIEKEGSSFLGIDGGRHMGYHPGIIGIERGVEIARATGLCLVGIHNTSHSGMLGFFARRIARAGLWGIATAHCMPLMAPYGGGKSVLGTNPVALGVPRTGHPPLVIDFSPSSRSYGSVLVDARSGVTIPGGAGLDAKGRPTTDPKAVLEGGTLLPAGGHKGSALALMLQLVCGPLFGAAPLPERGIDYGLGFLILRSDLFNANETTDAGVEAILTAVNDCPPAEGFEEVKIPGERSARSIESARTEGLAVNREAWNRVREIAAKAGGRVSGP